MEARLPSPGPEAAPLSPAERQWRAVPLLGWPLVLGAAPLLLTTVLGLASRFPAFSTVVSNVPGPRQTMYWNGARLDGIYPASIPFHGFAMNITLVSYADKLDFGIVACRRSVPGVQRIIDHMEEALVELEEAAGLRRARRGVRRARRAG